MKNNYKHTAEQIVKHVGGKENVVNLEHCMTRLRFCLKDESKVNKDELSSMKEVAGIARSGDQYHVVIGNEVNNVYNEVIGLGIQSVDDDGEVSENEDHRRGKKKGIFSRVIDVLTGVMTPMIPALTAAGMIKVILALLTTFNWMSTDADTYRILDIIGDTPFYFMPFLLAVNAARKFKVNTAMAVIVAGVFLHPNFSSWVSSGEPISFIGLPIPSVIYSASVIPVLLTVWIMSFIEKYVDKIVPSMLKIMLNPVLLFIISAPLALIVIGPIGNFAGQGLASLIDLLQGNLGFIMVALLAAAFPFIVMTGMHHALTPIFISAFAVTGQETLILVSQICANLAQGGATLAVAVRSKVKEMKQLASATWISSIMGITEPGLYGVTLKLKRPMIGAAIGACVAGLIGGLLHVTLYVPQNSIVAALAFAGDKGTSNIIYGLIMMLIAFVASFILTLILGFKETTDIAKVGATISEEGQHSSSESMVKTNASDPVSPGNGHIELYSPMQGRVVDLTKVNDPAFSSGSMGQGLAIVPDQGVLLAPVNGTVAIVAKTKHAVAMVSEEGMELLMHVGIDTVKLKGRHFTPLVKAGDIVRMGDVLMKFDLEQIITEGFEPLTPIIITNGDDKTRVTVISESQVKMKEHLANITQN